MKSYFKSLLGVSLLILTAWTYPTVNKDILNENNIINLDTNGKKPLVSDSLKTPDLKFKDENGNSISLKSLKGKVVFINLWATWCPPCVHEMPSINELKKIFKDNNNLVFLMVDLDNDIEKSKKWMLEKKFDLPVFVPESEIPRDLFTGSIPTTFLVDKKNNIIGRQVGGSDYSSKQVIDLINKLLQEN